jgi:hypothetical protein
MKAQRICPVCQNEYSGRSDKKYCSLECKNKESNKTVMQLYYAGKTIQEAATKKVLLAKEKLKLVRDKSSNILEETPKNKNVNGIGTLKVKVLKNPNQVQKKYVSQFLEEEQTTIGTLKEHLLYIEKQQLFDKSNIKALSSVAGIIKELKAGKVLSCVLTSEKKTTILKYLENDILQSFDYSVEI